MTRAAGELAAAIESMEGPTQKVLASTESIDECALAVALNDDYHQGLAQDVQDHVVRIYKACNFSGFGRTAYWQGDHHVDEDGRTGSRYDRPLRPFGN
ncbi:MAG TPA: hypothetical protein VFP60_04935 [Pseudolabrys sp.]|nr:hypothetical protein [Pseudolabrys sp.]